MSELEQTPTHIDLKRKDTDWDPRYWTPVRKEGDTWIPTFLKEGAGTSQEKKIRPAEVETVYQEVAERLKAAKPGEGYPVAFGDNVDRIEAERDYILVFNRAMRLGGPVNYDAQQLLIQAAVARQQVLGEIRRGPRLIPSYRQGIGKAREDEKRISEAWDHNQGTPEDKLTTLDELQSLIGT